MSIFTNPLNERDHNKSKDGVDCNDREWHDTTKDLGSKVVWHVVVADSLARFLSISQSDTFNEGVLGESLSLFWVNIAIALEDTSVNWCFDFILSLIKVSVPFSKSTSLEGASVSILDFFAVSCGVFKERSVSSLRADKDEREGNGKKDEHANTNNNSSLDSVPSGKVSVFPDNVGGFSSIFKI